MREVSEKSWGYETVRAETPEFLKIAPGFVIRDLYQNYSAAWQNMVNDLLTGPQYAVLAVLNENDGADQTSVAEASLLDGSTMVDVSRRLERRGLMVRTRSKVDGRRKVLHITALGEATLKEVRQQAEALNQKLFSHLPEQQEKIMKQLIELASHWRGLLEVPRSLK